MLTPWIERWKNNDIPFHLEEVNPLLRKHLNHFNIQRGMRVLVPLCGKSVDMIFLQNLGLSVVGIEGVSLAIDQFFSHHNLDVQKQQHRGFDVHHTSAIDIVHADFFKLPKEYFEPFDLIYDRASIIAIDPTKRKDMINMLFRLLKPKGEMFLITVQHPDDFFSGPPFSITEHELIQLCQGLFKVECLENVDRTDSTSCKHLKMTSIQECVYKLSKIN